MRGEWARAPSVSQSLMNIEWAQSLNRFPLSRICVWLIFASPHIMLFHLTDSSRAFVFSKPIPRRADYVCSINSHLFDISKRRSVAPQSEILPLRLLRIFSSQNERIALWRHVVYGGCTTKKIQCTKFRQKFKFFATSKSNISTTPPTTTVDGIIIVMDEIHSACWI